MTTTAQYIQQCLDQGFSQKQIADSLGCTESNVAQLMQQHGLVQNPQQQFAEHDELYQSVELLALQRLKRAVAMDPSLTPVALARIATQLNGAKRRSMNEKPVANNNSPIVHLHLPAATAAQFVFNGTNEAVAVHTAEHGTRVLSTASSKQVAELASQKLAIRAGGNHESISIRPAVPAVLEDSAL